MPVVHVPLPATKGQRGTYYWYKQANIIVFPPYFSCKETVMSFQIALFEYFESRLNNFSRRIVYPDSWTNLQNSCQYPCRSAIICTLTIVYLGE